MKNITFALTKQFIFQFCFLLYIVNLLHLLYNAFIIFEGRWLCAGHKLVTCYVINVSNLTIISLIHMHKNTRAIPTKLWYFCFFVQDSPLLLGNISYLMSILNLILFVFYQFVNRFIEKFGN